jgi:hypothetical protein
MTTATFRTSFIDHVAVAAMLVVAALTTISQIALLVV